MAKVFESMKEATGIDMASIINAESYEAKVNRNINLSGLEDVNLVVQNPEGGTGKTGPETEPKADGTGETK